jgi:DNA-binding NarL/FixJ family response regulator
MRDVHPSKSRPRILIADDHGIVAEGIRALLADACEVIGMVSDGRQLLTEAPRLNPEGIVVDIGMPLLNGLDAAERLKSSLPSTKFIFLTMQEDPNLAAAVLKLGTVGFVLKHAAASELLTAVFQVLKGKAYITPKLRATTRFERESRARQFSKELTPRQLEVLQRGGAPDKGDGGHSERQSEDGSVSQIPDHGRFQLEEQCGSGAVCA